MDIFRPRAVVSDELFPTDISRSGDSRIAHTYLPEGDLRIAHPFKGGIASPIPKVPKGRLSHSRTILCPEQTVGAGVGHWGIRPSLRDLCNRSFEPGSQLPGYSRISLRETKAANRSKLQATRRDEKKVFIRCGPIPLKTAENLEISECHRLGNLNRHLGTWTFHHATPPLKGWAILKSPIRERAVESLLGNNSTRPENVQTRSPLERRLGWK